MVAYKAGGLRGLYGPTFTQPAHQPFVEAKATMQTGSKPAKKKVPPFVINRHPDDADNPESGWFVQIPRFWVDEFFGHTVTLNNPETREKISNGARLPHAFWKYTLYLWRWLSLPRSAGDDYQFRTTISIDKFPMRTEAAVQWTAAYSVSGVVEVEMGTWTARNDDPTAFIYRPSTTHTEWRAFFAGLEMAANKVKKEYRAAPAGNTAAWRTLVALEVDEERVRYGLARTNANFVKEMLHEKNNHGQHIAELVDGIVRPVFYLPKRRVQDDDAGGVC